MKWNKFLCVLSLCGSVQALPVVESRTGQPVLGTLEEPSPVALRQIESLRQEVSELRGQLELQENEMARLKRFQQDLYRNLDQRVDHLAENKPLTIESPEHPVDLSDKEAFELGYSRIRSKEYVKAIVALEDYLERFPQGEHQGSAHYWIGEAYLARFEHDNNPLFLEKAKESFLTVTSHFPTHQKTSDALLKIGLLEDKRGDREAAKRYISEVSKRYPGSGAAQLANTQLEQF